MCRIVAGFALVFVFAFPSAVLADIGRADPFGRSKEQVQQAEKNRENAVFVSRVVCVALGGFLVWIAISIARNGLGFGPRPQRFTGMTARVFAATLGAAGFAIAIFGTIFVSHLFGPP
jgi:hypothetical protein